MESVPVSSAAVAAYHRDGFLVVEPIIRPAELASMLASYDELFESRAAVPDSDSLDLDVDLPQIISPERYAPSLVAGEAPRRARAIAEALLGPAVMPAGVHAICKPARHGSRTPWHQDEAYWDPAFEHRALSVWIPLQDVDQRSGCMEFLPGSHRRDVLDHELIGPTTHALRAVPPVDTRGAMSCPIPAGAATVHDARTLHHAGPNRSDEPRRAIVFAFRLPLVIRAVPAAMPWQRREWHAAPPNHSGAPVEDIDQGRS